MILVDQSAKILSMTPDIKGLIETAGRTCYQSHERMGDKTADRFVRSLIERGHDSVLEHGVITLRIITSRNMTHELVRHRLASYSQESTRYVVYLNEITFIKPPWFDACDEEAKEAFLESLRLAEQRYFTMRKLVRQEYARDVLPGCLKAEIVVTANVREWRHILKLRLSKEAHPQMRELMTLVLKEFIASKAEVLFQDIALHQTILKRGEN